VEGLTPSLRAVEMFRRLQMRPPLRDALSIRGLVLAETGNQALAIEAYAEALELAAESGDQGAEAKVCNNLGAALIFAGACEEAIACFERAVSLTRNDQQMQPVRATALGNIALACLHLEEYERGLPAARSSVALHDNPSNAVACSMRVMAELHYTWLLLEVGAPEVARGRCQLAEHFARASGLERAELDAGVARGLYEAYSGAVDVGLSRLSSVLQRSRGERGALGDALRAMVRANEMANRYDTALVYLRELMMHTKEVQQASALLHHRLHLEQVEQRSQVATSSAELMAQREIKLRSRLGEQVARQELMKARVGILERIAVSADLRGGGNGQHSYRVGKLAALLGQALDWDEDTVFLLELAAGLHDIGKIGIPERLLSTRRVLTQVEIELAQSHTLIGADILAQSDLPHMKMAEEIARFHHERWDGAGYPFGLAYTAIPMAARITALADAFDELTHAAARESALAPVDALHEIASERGRRFDPELTDRFTSLVTRLRQDHADLDGHLGQAAYQSPFIQARQKIASTLKFSA
jgi:putative two-component system response regulator